jgi:hypothetical protein
VTEEVVVVLSNLSSVNAWDNHERIGKKVETRVQDNSNHF